MPSLAESEVDAYAERMRRFGENLKAIRERKGITQEQLTIRMGLKRQAPISLWETGSKVPTPKTIRRLAIALECETWELMDGVVTEYDLLRAGGPTTRMEAPSGTATLANGDQAPSAAVLRKRSAKTGAACGDRRA